MSEDTNNRDDAFDEFLDRAEDDFEKELAGEDEDSEEEGKSSPGTPY